MNNSLPRLIDGMIATLRKEIIPRVEGEFARGQAFGVIYMLNSLKLRVAWSNEFLLEQLHALEEASRELEAMAGELAGAPIPRVRAPSQTLPAAELEALRDEGDAHLCELIDWLTAQHEALAPETARRADAVIDRYLHRQLKFELSTSARPMFTEIASGAEKNA